MKYAENATVLRVSATGFLLAIASVAFPLHADAAEAALVRNPDVTIGDSWKPRKLHGHGVVPLVGANFPRWDDGWDAHLFGTPLFDDMCYNYGLKPFGIMDIARQWTGKRFDPQWKFVPKKDLRLTPYSVDAGFNDRDKRQIERRMKRRPDLPFRIGVAGAARPFYFLRDDCPADRAAYLEWKKAHPNFAGFGIMTEFDNDAGRYPGLVMGQTNEAIRAHALARYPIARTIQERRDQMKRAADAYRKAFFGEEDTWGLYSLDCTAGHWFAAFAGIKKLLYEAELFQTSAPWVFGGAGLRGAVRQWGGLNYGWYCAHLVYGFTRDGKEKSGEMEWPGGWVGHVTPRPAVKWKGAGISLFKRELMYGAMIGAQTLEAESSSFFLYADEDGKKVPSPIALAMNDVYAFVRDLDRGASYTPVAVVTSIYEPFSRHGHTWRNVDKVAQNAFFFTLVPTCRDDVYRVSDRKKGDLGCLYNSPFGEIWDNLVADNGQPADAMAAAFRPYRALFLVGQFFRDSFNRAAIEEYVKGGGTLFCSADQVRDGFVSPDVAGVSFGDATTKAGAAFSDERGAVTSLGADEYRLMTAEGTPSASVLLKDSNGVPVAYVNDVGKGRVVTVAVNRMLPEGMRVHDNDKSWEKWWNDTQASITSGRRTFPIIRYLLARVQDETMPISVSGLCQWGLNKTDGGWLLWVFNNDGVVKYQLEPDEYDASKTSTVTVALRGLGEVADAESGAAVKVADGRFSFDVGPGGMRFFKIR